MKIWLVKAGEPLPQPNSLNANLLRTGQLAQFLTSKGNEVTWWTSNFNHFNKSFHSLTEKEILIEKNLNIVLLQSRPYKKNVSIARVLHHRSLANRFYTKATQETQRPDLIFCAMPTLEFCEAALRYGKKHQIPVVIDIRDLWPDIFSEIFPTPLRPLIRPAFFPINLKLSRTLNHATAITAISDEILNWALKKAKRSKRKVDRVFPLSHSPLPCAPDTLKLTLPFWESLGLFPTDFVITYVGAISNKIDFTPLLAAAEKLKNLNPSIKFILAGDGDSLDDFKHKARHLKNMIFPGWIDGPRKSSLFHLTSIGIVPLKSRLDFTKSIPNKAAEYFAEGIPILSGLRGKLENILADRKCGITYNQDLCERIVTLNANPSQLDQMAKNAIHLHEDCHNAEKIYPQFEDYFREILRIQPSTLGPATLLNLIRG